MKFNFQNNSRVIYGILIILAGIVVVGGYRYYVLAKNFDVTKTELGKEISEGQDKVANLELERTSLNDALQAERDKNTDLEDRIDELSDTVGDLKKLTRTDKELLKKYSKVYFLNENYEPPKLVNIDTKYLFDKEKTQQIHSQVSYFLKKLIDKAGDKDLNLLIASAYRSFGTQAAIKDGYTIVFGAGTANQFSAEQGFSEHQLGTAIDFITTQSASLSASFENMPEFKWLEDNAYKYGFILSYPKGNTYYQYEPWHWRFVGIKLAEKLHDENKYFYDLDQRDIDKYLINIFDK